MTTINEADLKYFAVQFEHKGKRYEKLMAGVDEKQAVDNYNFAFGDEPAISVRECTDDDCGQFFKGVRSCPVS